MNELESNPRGYVIQLYQYALRYKYNNTQLVEYINSLIDDAEEFKKAQSAKYTVLGDFDSIEINEVFHFRLVRMSECINWKFGSLEPARIAIDAQMRHCLRQVLLASVLGTGVSL